MVATSAVNEALNLNFPEPCKKRGHRKRERERGRKLRQGTSSYEVIKLVYIWVVVLYSVCPHHALLSYPLCLTEEMFIYLSVKIWNERIPLLKELPGYIIGSVCAHPSYNDKNDFLKSGCSEMWRSSAQAAPMIVDWQGRLTLDPPWVSWEL